LPERVTRAVLISSPAPFEVPGLKESLKLGQRLQFALAVKAPWLVRMMMRSYARAAQKMTAAQVLQKLKHDLPPAEFALFRQPGMIEMVIADTLEAFRQGGDACAHEWGLAGAPWGFCTSQIAVPVHVWQGDLDTNVSLAMGRYLGSTIPDCKVTVCPGGGHYIGLTHWAEILGAMLAE
jgi:pimeloyl-ACP methyl ester carboxylesterase